VAVTKTAKTRSSRNETPNTPEVSESKIARMKASELRTRLARRGVKGTDEMKKPELIKKFIKAESKSAKTAQTAQTAKTAKTGTADGRSAKDGRKKTASGNQTPNTPEVSESKIARMKASELRTRLARRGVKGTADMKKPELIKRLVKALTAKTGKTSRK
jgi:hypothetical protein